MNTCKAIVHWFDSKDGVGMVKMTYNNTIHLIPLYTKKDYYDFDGGDEIVINYCTNIALDRQDNVIEWPDFANINESLTRAKNNRAMRLIKAVLSGKAV